MQLPVTYEIPLNLEPTGANRLNSGNKYYSVRAHLQFSEQLKTVEQVNNYLKNALLFVELTPFYDDFRAKMLSQLKEGTEAYPVEKLQIQLSIDILQKKVLQIHTGKTDLGQILEEAIKTTMSQSLEIPFFTFNNGLQSYDKSYRKNKHYQENNLTSFSQLFPSTNPIEREFKNKSFILEDLYCVKKNCDCNNATCIIATFDESSQKEVIFGGFRFDLEKQGFKPLPDLPTQFNAQEWFKKFSANSPFDLSLLLKSRYDFLRREN